MNELNVFAKILIGLHLLGLISYPALIGREREPETYSYLDWIIKILGFLYLLLALEVI